MTTPTLTVTGITTSMNNNKYRCIVAGAYVCLDTSAFGKLLLSTTIVNNFNTDTDISVSPNPTTGDIFITGAGEVNIRVYDFIGQLVKEADNSEKISVAEMPAGFYAIKLFNKNGVLVHYDKIIKH